MEFLNSKLASVKIESRKTAFLVISVFYSLNLFGQVNTDTTTYISDIILIAENAPEFPGGRDELNKFVSKNLRYPLDARRKGIEGKLFVSFVVERDGTIKPENIKIEQGLYPSLDKEAIRLIMRMPKWIPANHSGRNVRAKTGFPLNFALK